MSVVGHRFLKIRRTLIDVSSAESKREGILLYRPGRWWLRWIPVVIGWFAWLPWPGRKLSDFGLIDCLIWDRIEEMIGTCKFVTIYFGNGSEKSKLTIKAWLERRRELTDCRIDGLTDCEGAECVIVKLGNTAAAGAAIRNEVRALNLLHEKSISQSVNSPISQSVNLSLQIPRVIGDVGSFGNWTWSVQTVLPRGKSPNRLQKEHFEFLEKLKEVGISHGDFAPWNCAIVEGKLVVWDWEDAGPWVAGKDEGWFRKQVKELLGVEA